MIADKEGRGINDLPRALYLIPYDLLRAIGRHPTGRAYELRRQSLGRLVSTTVRPNICVEIGARRRSTGWTQLVGDKTERSRGMKIELSLVYEGAMMRGGVPSIDRAYFDISAAANDGSTRSGASTPAERDRGVLRFPADAIRNFGAGGQYRRFKFEITEIAELPGFAPTFEQADDKREPSLRMRRWADRRGLGCRLSQRRPRGGCWNPA